MLNSEVSKNSACLWDRREYHNNARETSGGRVGLLSIFLVVTFNTARRVNKLLTTGEERMASRTNFKFKIAGC